MPPGVPKLPLPGPSISRSCCGPLPPLGPRHVAPHFALKAVACCHSMPQFLPLHAPPKCALKLCPFHSMPQSLAIVMEYAAGGDMFSHLRDRRCAYMQQRSMHMRCCCCIPAFKHAVQLGPAPLAHCMLLACQLSQRLSTSAPLHPPASAPASTSAPAGRARGL